jgi:hypothetical protein
VLFVIFSRAADGGLSCLDFAGGSRPRLGAARCIGSSSLSPSKIMPRTPPESPAHPRHRM